MEQNERVTLTAEQAVGALATTERIHTFVNPAGILVGADWDRERVHEFLEGAGRIEIAGGMARGMGHGIVAENGRRVFFAHDEDALAALDVPR